MRNVLVLGSTSLLLVLAGCSRNHTATASASAGQVAPTAAAPPSVPVVPEPATPLPAVATSQPLPEPWRPQVVNDHMGGAMVLKRISSDGKYDLVILEKGAQYFVSFTKHGQWESVHELAAKGKLMNLRLEFEDGQVRHAEWDELGAGTEKLHGVLWSYPAKADSVGGDQLLMQEMMKHKAMLVEIEPGITAQFSLIGLESETSRIRLSAPAPVLTASQSVQ
ncbi:MAG TPA: hypothetical protein VLX60_04345 [Terriglobales bacterium]|nr:hypothetical protein [Terriglobales bacterium]